MKCTKCGNENKEKSKFCRKCGTKLETETQEVKVENIKQQETKEEQNKEEVKEPKKEKKKGKKALKIILVLIILVVLGIVGYIVYNKFFYKYDAKIEKNLNQYFETSDEKYLEKIQDIILEYSDNEETSNKIKEVINKKIEKWIDDANIAEYKTEEEVEKAFSKIKDKIENLQKTNTINKETKEKYAEQILKLKDSKTNYIDGIEKYESQKYDKAYSSFRNVIEKDKLYESAQEYIQKCMGDTITTIEEEYKKIIIIPEGTTSSEIKAKYVEAYKYLIQENTKSSIDFNGSEIYRKLVIESMTKIIDESVNIVTENISKKEYSSAKTNITELLEYASEIASNKEYEEILKTTLTKTTEITIKLADTLISEYSYTEAKELLTNVKTQINSFKSSSTYTMELGDKITEIEGKMPVSLLSLSTRSKSGSISLRNYNFKDADGNQYEKGITSYCYYPEKYNCTYNLNGEYKRLKATYGVCAANSSKEVSAYIKVYGDDKLLYTSEAIKWDSMPKQLDVNISGVQMLKIEFVAEDLDRDVFIGNPELYK